MEIMIDYVHRLKQLVFDFDAIYLAGKHIFEVWRTGHTVFLCGNGGSAANAIHIANDLFYGAAKGNWRAQRFCMGARHIGSQRALLPMPPGYRPLYVQLCPTDTARKILRSVRATSFMWFFIM